MKRFAFLLFLMALNVAQAATDGAIYSQQFIVKESKANGTAAVTIQKPSLGSSYTLTLPDDDGNSLEVLKTDGSGGLSWGAAATAPATAGPVYSTGSALSSTAFSGNGNKVVGIDSGGTAQELKSFAVGTSGTNFAVAHGVGTVTFNLPDAGASARGAVTTGTQTIAGAKTFTSAVAANASGVSLRVGPSASEANCGNPSNIFDAHALWQCNAGDITGVGIGLHRVYSDSLVPAIISFAKARGTFASQTVVGSVDQLGSIRFLGFDGTSMQPAAAIIARVDGTPGSTDMPGSLGLYTSADGGATPVERVRIDNTGLTTVLYPLLLDPGADAIQARIQGHSTQTNDIFVVEKSDGTDLLEVTNTAGTKIRGTTTNDDAAAGFVGEYVEGTSTSGTKNASGLTNFDTISLTAGDWDVTANVAQRKNTATFSGTPDVEWCVNTTSASLSGCTFGAGAYVSGDILAPTSSLWTDYQMYRRVTVASGTQTVYLVQQLSQISTGSIGLAGRLHARRVR